MPADDADIRLVFERLGDLRTDVARVEGQVAEVKGQVTEARADIVETKVQVKETNGRVKTLELWKARADGAKWAVGWIPPAATALAAAVAGAALTYFLGG